MNTKFELNEEQVFEVLDFIWPELPDAVRKISPDDPELSGVKKTGWGEKTQSGFIRCLESIIESRM